MTHHPKIAVILSSLSTYGIFFLRFLRTFSSTFHRTVERIHGPINEVKDRRSHNVSKQSHSADQCRHQSTKLGCRPTDGSGSTVPPSPQQQQQQQSRGRRCSGSRGGGSTARGRGAIDRDRCPRCKPSAACRHPTRTNRQSSPAAGEDTATRLQYSPRADDTSAINSSSSRTWNRNKQTESAARSRLTRSPTSLRPPQPAETRTSPT